jgi:hypothetical protein
MTPEEKSLLERTYKLAEDNNAMLRSIRRTGRLALIMRALYWIVIIGFSVGAYYFIQPYLNQILDLYGSLSGMKLPF